MRGLSIACVTASLVLAHPALAGDPKAECISSADQAQQARDDGKYRAARDGFVSCSRSVCPRMVAASCTKWAREIEDGMPTVVLSAKDAHGGDLGDVHVTFDGATLASALEGRPVEVDPGSHKLRFEREGSEPSEQTVVIKAGEKLRSISVVLRPVAAVPEVHEDHVSTSKKSGNGPQLVTTAAFGVLAAGGIAGGVALAFASQGDSDAAAKIRGTMPANACAGAAGTTQSCQNLSSAVDAQNRDAAVSVALYVVGGVLAAAAVITWFAWPKPKTEGISARLLIGPTVGGFGGGIGGTF